jgi:hypothetical protein
MRKTTIIAQFALAVMAMTAAGCPDVGKSSLAPEDTSAPHDVISAHGNCDSVQQPTDVSLTEQHWVGETNSSLEEWVHECVTCEQTCTHAGDEEACYEANGELCAECPNDNCNHYPEGDDDETDR